MNVSAVFDDASRIVDLLTPARRIAVEARYQGLTAPERKAYHNERALQLALGRITPVEGRRIRDVVDGWDHASLPDRLAVTLVMAGWLDGTDVRAYLSSLGIRRQAHR